MIPVGDIEGGFLTGAGDTKIKRWLCEGASTGVVIKEVQAFDGHSDTVRALAEYPGLGFVSGAHDLTAKLWTLDGQIVSEFIGHKMLIYAVAVSQQGIVASGSEDNSVKIWRQSGECLQTIEQPGCSWSVKFLSGNEDLVTGCADAVCRIWTADGSRVASDEVMQQYEAYLLALKSKSEDAAGGEVPDGVTVSDISTIQQPGTKDGETKVVRENGELVAYNWSGSGQEWQKIGVVVSRPEDTVSAPRKWHNGREWDFVFDVDVEEDAPMLKLAVNRGDDVYDAAERFMQDNMLPLSYREQIVNFIIKNTQGQVGPTSTGQGIPDPFTGGNAYVPGQTGQGSNSQHNPSNGSTVTGGGVDPFTGGSSNPSTTQTLHHVPSSNYEIFRSLPNVENVMKKIKELNQQQVQNQLDEGRLNLLQGLWQSATKGGSMGDKEGDVLTAVIQGWSDNSLFPAFDLCRVLSLSSEGERLLMKNGRIEQFMESLQRGSIEDIKCAQTATKFLTNLFNEPSLRLWALEKCAALVELMSQIKFGSNDKVLKGVVCFLLNACIASKLQQNSLDTESKLQCFSLLFETLSEAVKLKENDSMFLCLVGIGTLIIGDDEMKQMAKDLDIVSNARMAAQLGDPKVGRASSDIVLILDRDL
eukprot:TRINITY_DN12645_c0_g1_i7.p1 TRINITY_DN12645_c0_g1~~TRINITY_DN12645_c0_g1_i7.p1  ORF type:complete len:643 (+),score=127.84 TRINITY_DN12645_c0_g1_i7:2-1930(+)